MLSERTLGFLEGLASASNAVYTEGGLQFTFTLAYRQARACSSPPLRAALLPSGPGRLALSDHDMRELGRFFQGALGNYTRDAPHRDALDLARSLIDRLRGDLHFDLALLAVEEGGYDMTAKLEMVHRGSNSLYRLELWWSVD